MDGLNALEKSLTLRLIDAGLAAFGSPFNGRSASFFPCCPLLCSTSCGFFGWEAAKRPTFSVYNRYYIPNFQSF